MAPTILAAVAQDDLLGLGVALAVGLLLGLQRERTWSHEGRPGPAGARTFPIVALAGCLASLAARERPDAFPGPWLPAAGFLAVGFLVVASYVRTSASGEHLGITTEAMLLLTYLLGVAAGAGYRELTAITGAASLVLVSLKRYLHGFAGRLTDEDESATLKFLAVALLVVPLLPDRDMGPNAALNPHNVGLMVVLVAGVSFVGYVAVKAVGPDRGLFWTGLLGGLASTTATTAAFARRSRANPELSPALATGTIVSCFVLFPRVFVLAWVADDGFARALLPHLGAMAVVGAAAAALGTVALRRGGRVDVALKNPFELAPAIWFAALYAVVVVGVKAAKVAFGDAGLYVAGLLSGITDVDPITLTAARLAHQSDGAAVLARVVVLAVIVNTVVKVAIGFVLGTPAFARRVALALLATAAAGGATFLWT